MDGEDPISHFFPGEENVDLYAILSLTESASQDDIKKSYRRLALTHHPDKHVASSESVKNDASTKFQQVGFAYAVLSDDKRRERYDRTGRTDEGFLEQAEGENGWEAYFEAMFEQVTRDKLDEMKLAYQGTLRSNLPQNGRSYDDVHRLK
jgi:DnaJ family protein C protein 9